MSNEDHNDIHHSPAAHGEPVFCRPVGYDDPLELYIVRLEALLGPEYGFSTRALALLLLQGDEEMIKLVEERQPQNKDEILTILHEARRRYTHPISYIIGIRRQREAGRIIQAVMHVKTEKPLSLREKTSRLLMNPMIGGPVLLVVLYYGLYKFVGSFGAGVLVDFLLGC